MDLLTENETKAIAAIKAEANKLTAAARAQLAQDLSWAERHIGKTVLISLAVGAVLTLLAVAAF